MTANRNQLPFEGLKRCVSVASIFARVESYLLEDGFSRVQSKRLCKAYRRFWDLKKRFPQEKLLVSKEIDTAWHAHLDREADYHQDCLQFFGGILPHITSCKITKTLEIRSTYFWRNMFGNVPSFTKSCCVGPIVSAV
jgi:hypothetical protein